MNTERAGAPCPGENADNSRGEQTRGTATPRAHAKRSRQAATSTSTLVVELKRHVPFTAAGAATGIAIMVAMSVFRVPRGLADGAFWTLHPLHVLLSALVTTAMYCTHGGRSWWRVVLVGYVGSIGIATLSDWLIPFAGEAFLDLPRRAVHLGFIEKWWLVNPLALAGILIGRAWPLTRLSHASHVLLSTWASLFHITMALGEPASWSLVPWIAVFLFLAVWVPCCTSDIVFPLLFDSSRRVAARGAE